VHIGRIPFHKKDPRVAGGTLATLRHWKLIEQQEQPDGERSKKASGFWRPTELGVNFVRRMARVPSHVVLYNNEVEGFTETTTDIEEALGKHFDYAELMGWGGMQ
jgi:hypothetical protein